MPRILLGIILFSLVIRIIGINSYPPSLNWDEVSHGYNAYSILETRKDEWGVPFPSIFRAYGDYKLPVYIYLTALSELIFGVNEFAVRLPSALAGVGTVLFSYFLVTKLFKDKKIALLTAFLVAIEPWTFFLSRIALEANVALFFIVSGIYFFLLGVQKKSWHLALSFLLLGLSVWTYNSARIFVPLLLLFALIIYRRDLLKILKNKTLATVCILLSAIFFIPMFVQLINSSGQARYGWVRILDEGAIASIEEQRNASELDPIVTKLIYNRPVYFLTEFVGNYFSHFSPSFLFLNGGDNYQFNIPNKGLLYIIDLPLFYLGMFIAFKNIKNKNYQLIIVWMLLAPIASSLTREAPHTLRNIVFLPVPMILTSVALSKVFKGNLVIFYIIAASMSFVFYISHYIEYSRNYSHAWQYGNQEVVSFIKNKYHQYDNIIITKKYGEPHEFVLFYWPWDPEKYQSDQNLNRFYQSNWYWVDGFDKFYFLNDEDVPQSDKMLTTESGEEINCENQRCLLITSPVNPPEGWEKLDEIKFLNSDVAYEIYQN